MAALRFPIQSRGASRQMASCASTVITRKSLPVFFNRLLICFSMIWTMRKAGTFTPLGALTQRIAAKLMTQRQAEINVGSNSATGADNDACNPPARMAGAEISGTLTGGVIGKGPCAATGSVEAGEGGDSANRIDKSSRVGAGAAGPFIAPLLDGSAASHASLHIAFLGASLQVTGQPRSSATSRT